MSGQVLTLLELCLRATSENAVQIGEEVMQDLPSSVLEMVSQYLSAEVLNNWHEIFASKGISLHKTWQNHLISRWPNKYRHEHLFLEKPWTQRDPRQLYLENHFHTLFRCATVDPGDQFLDFSSPLHRLHQNRFRDEACIYSRSCYPEMLLALAPFVKELTVYGFGGQVNYLIEHRDILDKVREHATSLVIHHLRRHFYRHVRATLLEELVIKGRVESLSLKHCVLDEEEWIDLMEVCTGKAGPGAFKMTLPCERKRKHSDASDSDEDDPDTKRLRAVADPGVTSSNPIPSTSSQPSSSALQLDQAVSKRQGLKSFSVYVTHLFDFSSILGNSLKTWTSLEKLEIWQPDAFAFKMVLPNEINKKVRCGQLRHGVISGCLAVAGQLPLLLEALLYRHSNGAEPLDHFELEGSYIWVGSQLLREFKDAMDFRGCKRMVLRESTIADDTCDLLSSMFETDGALQCVRLHEVKLGMVWGHVGRILQSLAIRGQLEILELLKVNCSEASHLLPNIISQLPHLRHLLLNDCSVSFSDESFEEFSSSIVNHPSLQVLSLSDNYVGDKACNLLRDLYTKTRPFSKIEMLDLKYNNIHSGVLSKTVETIKRHFCDKFGCHGQIPWCLKLLNLTVKLEESCPSLTHLRTAMQPLVCRLHLLDSGVANAEHISQM